MHLKVEQYKDLLIVLFEKIIRRRLVYEAKYLWFVHTRCQTSFTITCYPQICIDTDGGRETCVKTCPELPGASAVSVGLALTEYFSALPSSGWNPVTISGWWKGLGGSWKAKARLAVCLPLTAESARLTNPDFTQNTGKALVKAESFLISLLKFSLNYSEMD